MPPAAPPSRPEQHCPDEQPSPGREVLQTLAQNHHRDRHRQDADRGRPEEGPPTDSCQSSHIVDEIEGDQWQEPGQQQRRRVDLPDPAAQLDPLIASEHALDHRPAQASGEAEGRNGTEHRTRPGDRHAPDGPEDHAVGDGQELGRERDEAMQDHETDRGGDAPRPGREDRRFDGLQRRRDSSEPRPGTYDRQDQRHGARQQRDHRPPSGCPATSLSWGRHAGRMLLDATLSQARSAAFGSWLPGMLPDRLHDGNDGPVRRSVPSGTKTA